MVEDSYRLFYCGRCRRQTKICPRCDRGQIYCGPTCSSLARREKQRQAVRRYQATLAGRRRHAARQHAYRERRAAAASANVTHQGPAPAPTPPMSCVGDGDSELSTEATDVVPCHFCNGPCRPFARLEPLRTRRRDRLRLAQFRWRSTAPSKRSAKEAITRRTHGHLEGNGGGDRPPVPG